MNIISTQFRILWNPYLGLGRCDTRIIPYDCIKWSNTMYLPRDPYLVPKNQSIYSSETKWKYYPILGKHNDWEIMDFIAKGTDEEEYESVQFF